MDVFESGQQPQAGNYDLVMSALSGEKKKDLVNIGIDYGSLISILEFNGMNEHITIFGFDENTIFSVCIADTKLRMGCVGGQGRVTK